MDFTFIREVMNEQVRLNVALCEAKHDNVTLLREKEETVALAIKEKDEALSKCEEWKRKYEELYASYTENEKLIRIELKKIREDVEHNGAIPYDIMNDVCDSSSIVNEDNHSSDVSEESKNSEEVMEKKKMVVIDDKKEKRREYMKDYMKKKRESKQSEE